MVLWLQLYPNKYALQRSVASRNKKCTAMSWRMHLEASSLLLLDLANLRQVMAVIVVLFTSSSGVNMHIYIVSLVCFFKSSFLHAPASIKRDLANLRQVMAVIVAKCKIHARHIFLWCLYPYIALIQLSVWRFEFLSSCTSIRRKSWTRNQKSKVVCRFCNVASACRIMGEEGSIKSMTRHSRKVAKSSLQPSVTDRSQSKSAFNDSALKISCSFHNPTLSCYFLSNTGLLKWEAQRKPVLPRCVPVFIFEFICTLNRMRKPCTLHQKMFISIMGPKKLDKIIYF